MALKPLSQLSPAYRKRIEAALAKGKTRQAARGHKPKEHVERKQKAIAKHQLTSYQQEQVNKFAKEQAKRNPSNVKWQSVKNDLNSYLNGNYDKFKDLKQQRDKFIKSGKDTIGDKKFNHTVKDLDIVAVNAYWLHYGAIK